MALADAVRILTTTSGTGTYQLGTVPSGYLSPFIRMSSGNKATWRVESLDGLTWEIIEGTLTSGSPPTLSRDRIIVNSGGGTSAVNWPDSSSKRISQVMSADWLGATFGAIGYQKLPSGLIVQWGANGTSGAGSLTVTWPIAFPTACYSVLATISVAAALAYTISVGTPSAASATFYTANAGTAGPVGFNWLALGA